MIEFYHCMGYAVDDVVSLGKRLDMTINRAINHNDVKVFAPR